MKTIRAKFVVSEIVQNGYGTTPKLNAVYSTDPNSENKVFTDHTPVGNISLTIQAGKDATTAFAIGDEFYVDFTKVDKDK